MADKQIAKNGNRHQVASAWKIFKSPSTKELEDMVNGFSKDHEVEARYSLPDKEDK